MLAAAFQLWPCGLDGASPAQLEHPVAESPDRIPPQSFVGIGPTSPDGLQNLLCTSVGGMGLCVISLRTEGRDR
jgi:hypothetical protein